MNLLSVIESPLHPNFAALYAKLCITETRVNSMRKATKEAKKNPPDFVVAERLRTKAPSRLRRYAP